LPDTLCNEPFNLWFPEEKRFVFFLDAYWKKRSKDVQIIEVILAEITDILDAPDEDHVPAGIAANFQNLIKNAPKDQIDAIRAQFKEMPHQNKRRKIMDLFDVLKQYVDGDRLVQLTNTLNKMIREKLVVPEITSEEIRREVKT